VRRLYALENRCRLALSAKRVHDHQSIASGVFEIVSEPAPEGPSVEACPLLLQHSPIGIPEAQDAR
jgi:hypothetical protein